MKSKAFFFSALTFSLLILTISESDNGFALSSDPETKQNDDTVGSKEDLKRKVLRKRQCFMWSRHKGCNSGKKREYLSKKVSWWSLNAY